MKNVNKEEWKELIANTDNSVILDVRTPAECMEGIQPGASQVNIMNGAEFMDAMNKWDKSKTYFVYCRSGNRSGQACQIMESHGITNTYNLLGGMMSWDGEVVQP